MVNCILADMTVDIIILSHCKDATFYNTNLNCIKSLLHSEDLITFNIILIESNPLFDINQYPYPFPNFQIIHLKEDFNFNRFLNYGLHHSVNDWVAFINNDVIFHSQWLSRIFDIKKLNPRIRSFCPFDQKSKYLNFSDFLIEPFYLGYRVPIEFVGWCFVLERTVFDLTGSFDETFDLYFQDNDFALTLKKHKILHAMVPTSFVEHVGGFTTKTADASQTIKYREDKNKFIRKWGDPLFPRIKRKLFHWLKELTN